MYVTVVPDVAICCIVLLSYRKHSKTWHCRGRLCGSPHHHLLRVRWQLLCKYYSVKFQAQIFFL